MRHTRKLREKRARSGFTILELMLTVAIISVVAVVAIPAMAQARITANETSAIGSLKSIRDSNIQYRTRFGVYASTVDDLFNAGYITATAANPIKSGYTLLLTPAGTDFTANADPTDPGNSGNRYFFVDATGVIRFSLAGTASSADDPLDA